MGKLCPSVCAQVPVFRTFLVILFFVFSTAEGPCSELFPVVFEVEFSTSSSRHCQSHWPHSKLPSYIAIAIGSAFQPNFGLFNNSANESYETSTWESRIKNQESTNIFWKFDRIQATSTCDIFLTSRFEIFILQSKQFIMNLTWELRTNHGRYHRFLDWSVEIISEHSENQETKRLLYVFYS